MRNANIKIWVSSPQNLEDTEEQVYTNYNGLTVEHINSVFGKECVLHPVVGNFPQMGGSNKPVRIVKIFPTRSEDNAGMDIAIVLERYKDWGSKK